MASRDIANMHFFLDLKKKFPDLPDDVLRSHVSLFSEDREKCISLLQKESQNHYFSSQPFADFCLPDGKTNARRSDNVKGTVNSMPLDISGTRLTPHIVKPESRSAPVIHSLKEPFADIYRQNSMSSQSTLCHLPSHSGQTMFSTTKEHRIGLPKPRANLICGLPEQPGRHTVRLSMMPSFPFQQQQNYRNSAYAGTFHSSRLGRHTTSVNFQLQPHSSDERPFVISAIPANVGDTSHSGSHVQISVGSQGASFTALRFQHAEGSLQVSSQAKNSYSCLSPDKSPNSGTNSQNSSALFRSTHTSPSYILAVKNQQIAQLDLILNELEKEKATCSQLRAEISKLEQKTENNNSINAFSFADKLNELREENKQLRTECNCLYIETDMYGSSEIPPCETEDFYSHIFTGPNGAILPHTKAASETSFSQNRSKSEREQDNEKSQWVCKKCTFANHPALEKCEMCEVSKDIDSAVPTSKGLPPRAAVQISITRSPKNLKFHLASKTMR